MGVTTEEAEELFQWKEQYRLGVEEIDNAHQRLFSIVRRLLKNLTSGEYDKNKITCMEAIKFLKQYTIEHFAQEEAFQLKVGYGGYKNHKHIHDNMREITLPALEKKMVESNFSLESVEHFAGVCAAWLSAHIMLEDQAITGKIKSCWDADIEGDEMDVLRAHLENFMTSMFQVDAEPENMHYDAYDLGDTLQYYQIFRGSDNTTHRTILILDRKLVCSNIGQIICKELTDLTEIAMSMFEELAMTFVTSFIAKYNGDNNLVLLSSGLVEKKAFKADFANYHPDISMLWRTSLGYEAFCIKSIKPKVVS